MIKRSLILINSISSLSAKLDRILKIFPDPDELLVLSQKQMNELRFWTENEKKIFCRRKAEGFADKELAQAEQNGIFLLDIFDRDYPSLLREISSPPAVLYVRGCTGVLNELCLAVVGTRIPTVYGREMAARFSSALAGLNCVVVSGLARGIDTFVHSAALSSGRTIAVLGSGLEHIYPGENTALAEKISLQGAVISEFPLSAPPLKENFPRRNRIISGLSRGVLVIEAPVKSGSLITARLALEQNREVFALPGRVNSPLSAGTHHLIKQGARLVDSVEDIVDELQIHFTPQQVFALSDQGEKSLFDMIGISGMSMEEILIRSGLGREHTARALLSLQVKGLIKELRPLYYTKVGL